MTEAQYATIQECIDATTKHFEAVSSGRILDSEQLDGIAYGLAITEGKLRTILRESRESLGSKIPRGGSTLARILREIRRKANYENAKFSDFDLSSCGGNLSPDDDCNDYGLHIHFPCDVLLLNRLTAAIKESTRLYRDSWVNPLIDGLIAWTEGKADIRRIEKDYLD